MLMLLGGKVAGRYLLQVQWQLACSGRAWCDFVSYDPRMPPTHALFVRRVARDADLIAELEAEVAAFLAELEGKLGEHERHSAALQRRVVTTPGQRPPIQLKSAKRTQGRVLAP